MNAIQKLTLTNIRQNKKRTVATILGILLSTALICAVAGMVSSGVESLKNYLRAHDGDYHVWFDNVPAEQVSLITEDEQSVSRFDVENIPCLFGDHDLSLFSDGSRPGVFSFWRCHIDTPMVHD